jgi:hypothetical protein
MFYVLLEGSLYHVLCAVANVWFVLLPQVNLVTAAQRNDTIQWFSQLNKHFGFYPETFFLSTTMLDKVLSSVKVRNN